MYNTVTSANFAQVLGLMGNDSILKESDLNSPAKNFFLNKFFVVDDFCTSEEAESLANNFINFCEINKISGDVTVANSRSFYNYPEFKKVLYDKVHLINQLLKVKVFPTYAYGRIYRWNSSLLKHTDRPACEISVSLHLKGDLEWPICFGNEGEKTTEIVLRPGQAVIYKGPEIRHWRPVFKGFEYVQTFLHYVDSEGPYSQFENDRR